ncbi:probable WRKY transcription factor 14 isoform X2 [Hevea brasiliensis]|uniref:probable WRKY transcription factor 14 isoform X2 n=1 Tax=Hevea brasiliensis TaxID=3981 RepID=UPI0025D51011|nr:probable WRKY transcription factor 14 isoform X2 [Hevea brasiliensis]
MCSFFGLEMDNYQGDLTDIVRASAGALGQSDAPVSNWEFPSKPLNLSFSSSAAMEDNRDNVFGDPFCNMRDPLLHELNVAATSGYFSSPNSTDHMLSSSLDAAAAASSPRGFKASSMASIDMINTNTSKTCLIDNAGPVQISPPRNLGIKRRKSQAKKVVCIPAPAAANSRPSGEVVPSDLWAWRKYGQKPIKGSPYPRGYYRCSSSKGCSARKQVERSRTDPNMLVITYTSEHNHPWPTQRNALAGSTRSQPPKNNAGASKSSLSCRAQKTANTAEEYKENSNDTLSPTMVGGSSTASAPVKEEVEDIEKQMEIDDTDRFSEGFPQSYRPAMPAESNQSEDFFADLGEIEADPLDLLFSQGFTEDVQKENKALDPFGLFDWSGDTNTNISFGEANRGL